MSAGQYTSTEAAAAGWFLTSIVCDDANSTGSAGTRTRRSTSRPARPVTCTFTNTKLGTITIEKQTLPDGDSDVQLHRRDARHARRRADVVEGVVARYVSRHRVGSGRLGADVDRLRRLELDRQHGHADGNVRRRRRRNVKCVFTNTKQGGLIVKKVMVGGTGTFTRARRAARSRSTTGRSRPTRPRSVRLDRGRTGRLGP